MSTKTMVMAVILSAALVGATVHAQETAGFQKGDRTLTLSGSGSSDEHFDANIAALEVGIGWFLSDDVAVELRQGVGFADLKGSDLWNASTRLGLDYYFLNTDRWQPFVGASVGYLYGDGVKEQFVSGPDVGIKVFVNDTTFISLMVEYQFLFEDADKVKDTYDDGRFVYALGMGVKW